MVKAYVGDSISLTCGADGVINGKFVEADTTAGRVKLGTAGGSIIGVANGGKVGFRDGTAADPYDDGDLINVQLTGVIEMIAGGTIATGDYVISDGNGEPVAYAADDLNGTFDDEEVEASIAEVLAVRGQCVDNGAADGESVLIRLIR